MGLALAGLGERGQRDDTALQIENKRDPLVGVGEGGPQSGQTAAEERLQGIPNRLPRVESRFMASWKMILSARVSWARQSRTSFERTMVHLSISMSALYSSASDD
ncbi:MAG: hypothetical protein LBH76_02810 [Propionibacteriaceae bacterium]|nr:hypothetical protein [Propionibacteriaceae bacterium]